MLGLWGLKSSILYNVCWSVLLPAVELYLLSTSPPFAESQSRRTFCGACKDCEMLELGI